MAKKNAAATAAQNAAPDAGGEQATGNGAGTKTTKPRDPATTLYFNDERDDALMVLILTNNGQLTTSQIATQLANHPAYADQASLLMEKRESFRQRVKKLSKRTESRKGVKLELKRTSNTGYDPDEVIDRVFAKVYGQPIQSQPTPPAVQGQGPGNPVAGGFTGGLIPTS